MRYLTVGACIFWLIVWTALVAALNYNRGWYAGAISEMNRAEEKRAAAIEQESTADEHGLHPTSNYFIHDRGDK